MPRHTVLPDARVTPRFAGIATFCRYPRLEDVAKENLPVDWAMYGVPFDGGVTYRPGARVGPRAIREASQYVKRYHIEHDTDVCASLSLADAGDSPIQPYSCRATHEAQLAFARALGDPAATRLFAVGGDHSIAEANVRAVRERFSPDRGIALIHFDSHLDTVEQVWGERHGHASVFHNLIRDKHVDPSRMISLGIKGPLNTPDDLAFAQRHGIRILSADTTRQRGVQDLASFVKSLAGAPVHISFDIDVVDPAFAPGTGTPSIGGLSSHEVLTLLRAIKGANIIGADIVEVLPDRDVAGITSLLAAHILFEIIALTSPSRKPVR